MVSTSNTADMARRPEVERLLDEYQVEWRYEPNLPFTRIDEKRSFGNQARIDQPLIPELVETYVEARKQGDVFPAIVVLEDRANKPVVTVDGNHRYASAKQVGDSEHAAYVIKAKPETVRVLMTLLNVIHGRSLSDKERFFHAFFLIDQGMRIDKAAEVLRLPVSRLKSAWSLEGANRRARDLGMKNKAWSELPQTARVRLASTNSDAAFREITGLALKADLRGDALSKLVSEVNKIRSERGQLDRVAQEAAFLSDQIQSSAGGRLRRQTTPKNQLRMHLGAINKIDLSGIPVTVSDEEGEILAQICLDASEQLNKLADRLTS